VRISSLVEPAATGGRQGCATWAFAVCSPATCRSRVSAEGRQESQDIGTLAKLPTSVEFLLRSVSNAPVWRCSIAVTRERLLLADPRQPPTVNLLVRESRSAICRSSSCSKRCSAYSWGFAPARHSHHASAPLTTMARTREIASGQGPARSGAAWLRLINAPPPRSTEKVRATVRRMVFVILLASAGKAKRGSLMTECW
jgi:hypothetical protein